ncbi:MAG TPA: hypothetical protein VMW07_03245 [Gallionella sp.]|jgi:hypothetical protein|nr:hypothetical protein [Gallionella sp.]
MTTRKTVAATAKAAIKKLPVEKPAVDAAVKKPKKEAKVKIVRDSFTMPQNEYQKIAEIKEACLEAGLQVKKSEVLRAGLKVLAGLNAAQLKRALAGLEKIKTGRPKKR